MPTTTKRSKWLPKTPNTIPIVAFALSAVRPPTGLGEVWPTTPRRSAWSRRRREYYNSRGGAFFDKRALDQAIADGTEAIRLNPNKPLYFENRSLSYKEQGGAENWKLALADAKHAVELNESANSLEAADIVSSLNNLANLYQQHGDYAEAGPLFQCALRIDEKAFVPHHSSTAIALNNLAELYRTQGNYSEAPSLHQQALKIYEEVFGPEDPQHSQNLK